MKSLTIQQPWASLVCYGIKDVENRTWKPDEVPGRILIHAGSKKIAPNFFDDIPEEIESYIFNDICFGNIPDLDTLPTGAIIGYVTVTGFEEGEMDSVWADGKGVTKWKLEDAWLFDEPIQNVRGKLGLFDFDLDENDLPPAHQADLSDVDINDAEDEVFIPCDETTFQQIRTGEYNSVKLFLTNDLIDILCLENEGLDMKPFKKVTVGCDDNYMQFELTDGTGVYNIPDLEDEEKPYVIQYHDGIEGVWMEALFVLGKKLDEGKFESFCGGEVITDINDILKK